MVRQLSILWRRRSRQRYAEGYVLSVLAARDRPGWWMCTSGDNERRLRMLKHLYRTPTPPRARRL